MGLLRLWSLLLYCACVYLARLGTRQLPFNVAFEELHHAGRLACRCLDVVPHCVAIE